MDIAQIYPFHHVYLYYCFSMVKEDTSKKFNDSFTQYCCCVSDYVWWVQMLHDRLCVIRMISVWWSPVATWPLGCTSAGTANGNNSIDHSCLVEGAGEIRWSHGILLYHTRIFCLHRYLQQFCMRYNSNMVDNLVICHGFDRYRGDITKLNIRTDFTANLS